MFKNNYSPIKKVHYQDNDVYKIPRELLGDLSTREKETQIHEEVETVSLAPAARSHPPPPKPGFKMEKRSGNQLPQQDTVPAQAHSEWC